MLTAVRTQVLESPVDEDATSVRIHFALKSTHVANDVAARRFRYPAPPEARCKAHRCWAQWLYPLYWPAAASVPAALQDHVAELLAVLGTGVLAWLVVMTASRV